MTISFSKDRVDVVGLDNYVLGHKLTELIGQAWGFYLLSLMDKTYIKSLKMLETSIDEALHEKINYVYLERIENV